MGRITISMVIFHSYVTNNQRVMHFADEAIGGGCVWMCLKVTDDQIQQFQHLRSRQMWLSHRRSIPVTLKSCLLNWLKRNLWWVPKQWRYSYSSWQVRISLFTPQHVSTNSSTSQKEVGVGQFHIRAVYNFPFQILQCIPEVEWRPYLPKTFHWCKQSCLLCSF